MVRVMGLREVTLGGGEEGVSGLRDARRGGGGLLASMGRGEMGDNKQQTLHLTLKSKQGSMGNLGKDS